MTKREKRIISVLIVDDSKLFRNYLKSALEKDPRIEVVGMAGDPYEARDKILKLHPDVMTLDVNMPKMSGIEFLKKLMPQYPMPVVVVSSASGIVFDAIEAGAVEFVEKPASADASAVEAMLAELVMKVKISSTSNLRRKRPERRYRRDQSQVPSVASKSDRVIAIGASTGGTEAIYEVIRNFPSNCPPTIIVQHMPPVFTKMYADRMHHACEVDVYEAKNGDWLHPGTVLIAPGEHHMRLVKRGDRYKVEVFRGDKVNGHRPSVDVLFESVAQIAKEKAVGVILTGMGKDGAHGLLQMRQSGARTIGQSAESCVVYGMPKAAYEMGAVECQVPIFDISARIMKLISEEKKQQNKTS